MKRDEFSGVRCKAREALSKIGDPAVDPLIAALQYPDEDVRWKAAIALGEIGNLDAIAPLISLLANDDRYV
ncbi:MAG: HEAT repeat domain-containing protein [Methanomicrobiales archaeon]